MDREKKYKKARNILHNNIPKKKRFKYFPVGMKNADEIFALHNNLKLKQK